MDISVIVPTFNRARLIGATLDAILAQTMAPHEIIVVDDGSTDDTARVLAAYAGQIKVVRMANSGVQVARNTAIELARSDWIALCDSDDIWLDTHLERHAHLLEAEPGITLTFGNFRVMRDGVIAERAKFDDAPPGFWDSLSRRIVPEGWVFDTCIAEPTFRFHPIFPSAMLISKQLAQSAGGFNSGMPARAEDGEFTLRCLYRAKVGAIPDPLVHIRRHESNASGDLARSLLAEVVALRYIKANHTEAVPYHATIDSEITQRTIDAIDAAFAAGDHPLTLQAFRLLPWRDRSLKLHIKRVIAGMPAKVGVPMNRMLQAVHG